MSTARRCQNTQMTVTRLKTAFCCCLLFAGAYATSASSRPGRDATEAPVAEQITPQNFSHAIRGSSAIAGLGDWMLSNGTLCASISDPAHETYLSYRGGTLVDLGFCGRNDDQWNTYHELFNLSREKILPAGHIDTEITKTSATLIVKGKMAGIENETRYRMEVDRPNELFIETRLTRTERPAANESGALYLFGSLILHPHRSLTPFVLSTTHPEYSKGFQHPFVDTRSHLAMLKVMFPADVHILVGAEHIKPEISYGVQSESITLIKKNGEVKPLRQFAINDQEFTLIGNFTNPLWFDTGGPPGLLQFMQMPLMDLDVGESLVTKKRILVSPTVDVASIIDQFYKGKAVPEEIKKLVPLKSSPKNMATLILPKGKIMHLVFKGVHGTADPLFFPDTSGFRVGEKVFQTDISSNRISLAGLSLNGKSADLKSIAIPAGDYQVYATRGPEYSLTKTMLHIKPDEQLALAIEEPKRVLETPGWISADFHVHSEFSFDSTLPAQRRVIDFVAQGGEVMVSTEHKRTINYQPIVEQLGLQHKITAIAGVELTGMAHTDKIPRTMGHSNVFPVTADAQQFMGGTLPHENRRLGEIIEAYKQKYPDVVFQLNHPRASESSNDDADDDINYFEHLSIGKKFNSLLPLDDKQNASLIEKLAGSGYRDIAFDAIELMNGQDVNTYQRVREDWFSLLRQGYRKTATADSDSHTAGEVVAMPRNYVFMEGVFMGKVFTGHADSIDHFDKKILAKAVLQGKVFGTTGPLLNVHLNDKNMGETFRGKQGTLAVDVAAADWIPVEKLSVYLNGKLYKELPVARNQHYDIPIVADKDSFVTIEVSGIASDDYTAVYPGFKPFAFSNPIFIDADGDGLWTAPGLNNY